MKTIVITPWQRIALHARCLVQRPSHARFHLAGISREIGLGDAIGLVLSLATAITVTTLATLWK
jgi:hypothetical protein